MELEKIDIINFRSVKEVTLTFDEHFQILVGINEAGKSNILNACSLLDQKLKTTPDDIREASHDEDPPEEAHVRFVFRLGIHECYRLNKTFLKKHALTLNPRAPIITESGKHYALENIFYNRNNYLHTVDLLKSTRHNQQWRTLSNFTVHKNWKRVKAGANHGLKTSEGNVNISSYKIVNTNDFEGIPEGMLEELSPKELNSLIYEFTTNEPTLEIPNVITWKFTEENLLPGRIPLSGFSSNPNTCIPLKNMFALSGYDDAAKALNEASNKKNGVRNLLRKVGIKTSKHMSKVWPEWKKYQIDLIQNGDTIEAGIQDEYNTYSVDRRSDGFKRFFTFLLMISAKNESDQIENNIIIIDEADTGLHPTGIQYLAKELKKIGEKNLVMTSTHSIFMIDKNNVQRHLIVERNKEVTKVSRANSSNIKDEEVIFKALGYSLFELLKPINIIFEGWRDKHLLETFLRSVRGKVFLRELDFNKLGFLHAAGVKDIERIAITCENFGRKYVVISDSDKPAKERQRAFKGQGEWLCYNDIDGVTSETTEDFMDTRLINKCVKDALRQFGLNLEIHISEGCLTGKLDDMASTLRKNNLNKDAIKQVLNAAKDKLSHTAKAANLNDRYDLVVAHLVDKVKELQVD